MVETSRAVVKNKVVDPIACIRGHPSPISSLCFIHRSSSNCNVATSNNNDDDDDCFFENYLHDNYNVSNNDYFVRSQPQILASCDVSGNAFLWNTATRRKIAQFGFDPRGQQHNHGDEPGLCLKRLMPNAVDDNNNNNTRYFLYHTRGVKGLVSILDSETTALFGMKEQQQQQQQTTNVIFKVQSFSSTFCAAQPCRGDANLIVTPSNNECVAHVYDIRCSNNNKAAVIHGAGRPGSQSRNNDKKKKDHGMLTSLSMSLTTGNPIVACGMENGEIYFHDCRAIRNNTEFLMYQQQKETQQQQQQQVIPTTSTTAAAAVESIQVSRDPILCSDLFESSLANQNESSSSLDSSVLAICGCAGDAADLNALVSADNRSTGAIVKVSFLSSSSAQQRIKISSRFNTCNISENAAGGKPGISCCRIRDDGKLFAIGGWDHRARIFTTRGKPLAILKGHDQSVTAVDWATSTGSACSSVVNDTCSLLSTGSSDGKILLWRLKL